jgi:hypothetical protein
MTRAELEDKFIGELVANYMSGGKRPLNFLD